MPCRDCGGAFVFTAGEQEFYAQKGFGNDPTRCPLRRRQRKGLGGTAGLAGQACTHDVTGRGRMPADDAMPPRARIDDASAARPRGERWDRDRAPVPRHAGAGVLPDGPVAAQIVRIDGSRRFLFARLVDGGADVYVHASLFEGLVPALREGDTVTLVVGAGERGPRAVRLQRG
jgi:cold shock CspA family protein